MERIRTGFGGCVRPNVVAPAVPVWWGASNPTDRHGHAQYGRWFDGERPNASGSDGHLDHGGSGVVGAGYAGLARRDTDNGRNRRHSITSGKGSDWNLDDKRDDSR